MPRAGREPTACRSRRRASVRLMGLFKSRIRAIRSSWPNVVLAVAGCLLVLLGAAWRLAIAPAIRSEPTDIEQVLYYDGAFTYYAGPPGQAAAGQQPRVVPVRIEREELSQPLLSIGAVAVTRVETRFEEPATRNEIFKEEQTYSLSRETGEMLKGSETGKMSGWLLVFPFGTPRGTVRYWSGLTGGTVPAKYIRTETLEGLRLYRFAVAFENLPMAEPPRGYPRTLTGAQLKQMLSSPGLAVPDAAGVPVSYRAGCRIELLVEPQAGNIVDMRGTDSVSISWAGREGAAGVNASSPLYRLDYARHPASVDSARRFAAQELSKFKLQFAYIPLGLWALGALMLLVGFLAVKTGGQTRFDNGYRMGPEPGVQPGER